MHAAGQFWRSHSLIRGFVRRSKIALRHQLGDYLGCAKAANSIRTVLAVIYTSLLLSNGMHLP